MSGFRDMVVTRFDGQEFSSWPDSLAVEAPLEIRLAYGPPEDRVIQPISVTMRTPGNDAELAAGFLLTEGVIHDETDIDSIALTTGNSVTVRLSRRVQVSLGTLQRNFYTTSSCGICGKASLLALRTVCPARRRNDFGCDVETLLSLPAKLRETQGIFDRTGGLHAAALFDVDGQLDSMREDVGRHNAVDKLIGAAFLEDRLPRRDRLLLLSGRASFELLQKAVMAGIPMVASVGAPSSLAVEVARDFDVTLIGFLRDNHCNVYHGADRVRAFEKVAG